MRKSSDDDIQTVARPRAAETARVNRVAAIDPATESPILRALARLAEEVLPAEHFDDVLEVVAEQTLRALEAASLSISRWEPSAGVLRTLVNVGDLAPNKQRRPQSETYSTTTDFDATKPFRQHPPVPGAPGGNSSRQLSIGGLRHLAGNHEIAAPVVCGDVIWGEIWAARSRGQDFTPDEIALLRAIAVHAAVYLRHSELFSTIWGRAHQDPLTGMANRRALDQFLAEMDCENSHPVVMVCDLDGFKEINDRDGHLAGDDLLRRVAAVLNEMAAATPGSSAARLGGDEFCVLMTDSTLEFAEAFANTVSRTIHQAEGPSVSVSWGAATAGTHAQTGPDLLASADAALLDAKRQGPARFSCRVVRQPALPSGRSRGVGATYGRRAIDRLASRVLRTLQKNPELTVAAALEVLATGVQQSVNTAAWVLSVCAEDDELRPLRGVSSVRDAESGLSVLVPPGVETYKLSDFPASAKAIVDGTTFVAAPGLAGSDPAETALLAELGFRAVLGVGVRAEQRYLLEFFSYDGHSDLEAVAADVEVLAHYCAARATGDVTQ